MNEKWSKGKPAGCVVSDTPNAHGNQVETTEYYGGYLVAESIPRQDHVNLIAAAPDLLRVVERLLEESPSCGCGLNSCSVCGPTSLYGEARATNSKAKGKL